MATFSVIAPRGTSSTALARFYIKSTDGAWSFAPSFAPLTISYGGFGMSYSETPRPGRKAIVAATNILNKTMSFSLLLTNKVPSGTLYGGKLHSLQSIEWQLSILEIMATSSSPLTVEYEPRTAGLWVITKLNYDSVTRDPNNNQITRAEVSIEMMEYTKFNLVAIAQPAPKPAAKPSAKTPAKHPAKKKPTYRIYTVKKGNTLHGLAKRFYGNANKWKRIADAQHPKIRKASTRLKAGRKLRIPK